MGHGNLEVPTCDWGIYWVIQAIEGSPDQLSAGNKWWIALPMVDWETESWLKDRQSGARINWVDFSMVEMTKLLCETYNRKKPHIKTPTWSQPARMEAGLSMFQEYWRNHPKSFQAWGASVGNSVGVCSTIGFRDWVSVDSRSAWSTTRLLRILMTPACSNRGRH